jgi:drug/metabolite transporter (DMT)-like permease
MNSKQNNKSHNQNTEKLKEIPKWTRKYAQNRTLTVFVYLAIVGLISVVITVPVSCLIVAFQKGNMILASVGVVALIAVVIFLCIFRAKNIKIWKRIDQRIYGHEGTVSMPEPKSTRKKKWLELAAVTVWGSLFLGTIYLGMENFIQAKYVQPVSALYCVPYMVFSWYFWQRPKMGPIVLLSPTLYAIHAILIIAGAPMFFKGQSGAAVNMSLPLIGYGFLSYVIAHFYGRYALKKLKDIAHLDGGSPNGV